MKLSSLAPVEWGRGGRGLGLRALMGLKNEFLCRFHCKPCTCYLNLTCHKSDSSKQGALTAVHFYLCGCREKMLARKSDRHHKLLSLRLDLDPKKQECRVGDHSVIGGTEFLLSTWASPWLGLRVRSVPELQNNPYCRGFVCLFLSCNNTFQWPFSIINHLLY